MKREHLNGLYRIDVYFLARQLADLPLFLLTPAIFMVIYYFLVLPYNGFERFIMSTIIIIVVAQVPTKDLQFSTFLAHFIHF